MLTSLATGHMQEMGVSLDLLQWGAVPLVPSTGEVVTSVATDQVEEEENALKI